MTLDEMKRKLENSLTYKRYVHSINVMDTAAELAEKYHEDTDKAAIAGLLHDCARDIRGSRIFELCNKFNIEVDDIMLRQPELLHGMIGAHMAEFDYGVSDGSIRNAIRCHTIGSVDMGMLDKIIFIADYIEPGRNFSGIDKARELAFNDIDAALLLSFDKTIDYVISKGKLIHPGTIAARNSILMKNLKDCR